MKRLVPTILFALALLNALPAFALEDDTLPAAPAPFVPIPLSTGWVDGFLLIIVWLFVIAILVGPLVTYFQLEPRSRQSFVDDKKVRSH